MNVKAREVRKKRLFGYLGIDYKYLSFWNPDFSIAELIGISVAEPGIKWIVIRREKLLNILHLFIIKNKNKKNVLPIRIIMKISCSIRLFYL